MGTYKDSGIEWIGEVPEGWGITRMQDVASYKKGPFGSSLTLDMFVEKGESTYKVYEQKNAIQGDSHLGEYYIDEKTYNQLRGFSVQSNDIIVSCAGTIGKCTILPENCEPGIINQALMRVRINKNINIFYYLYLFNIELDYADRKFSNGSAIKNIPPFNVLKKLKLPLPPLQEQAAIADFLDKKNAEIDAITEKITQQIQILKDYRQSLITQTVTKGLDKTIAYEDSGIESIGEIPEGWEISTFKYLFDTNKGLTITKENLVEVGIPVINYGQIHSTFKTEVVSTDNALPKVSETFLIYQKSLVKQGDFIFADTSEDLEGAGNFSTRLDSDSLLFAGYHTIISRAKYLDKFNYNYFKNLFDSDFFRNQIRIKVSGVKVFSITQSILNNCMVLVPPLQEQAAIADFLDDKTAKIDRIIAKKEQQLDIIKEHRKSLIYEYVTGKKRVKEYQQDGN